MERENSFMRTKPVFPLLVSMSVPMMLSMLIQSLYNIVDSIYVSRLGTDALTAVSLAYPLQNAIVSVGVGIGVGISSAISIHLGSGDQEKADRAATLGVVLTFFHCILFDFFPLHPLYPCRDLYHPSVPEPVHKRSCHPERCVRLHVYRAVPVIRSAAAACI